MVSSGAAVATKVSPLWLNGTSACCRGAAVWTWKRCTSAPRECRVCVLDRQSDDSVSQLQASWVASAPGNDTLASI